MSLFYIQIVMYLFIWLKKKSHLFLSTYNNTAELINILLPALTEQ